MKYGCYIKIQKKCIRCYLHCLYNT